MSHPNPNRYASIQEYLENLGFKTIGDWYVCGDIRFAQLEISGGFTPTTFAAKMRARGWMPPDVESPVLWPRV